jgi:integral membrane protein (TIGR00529 family)
LKNWNQSYDRISDFGLRIAELKSIVERKSFVVELVKIGIVFLAIIVLMYRKVSLWLSLLLATFFLGILFRLPISKISVDLISSVVDPKTLLLIGAFVSILFFSNLLKETGRMNQIMEGFRSTLKDVRLVIALLPAIIGLMPIAGGALVSAPMVVEGSDELKLSPERRTFINYWFRHLWEYVLPTYPALVLAASLVGIPVRKFCWLNLPLTPAAILSGIAVGYWGVSKSTKPYPNLSGRTAFWSLFKNLFPLLIALILVVGFKVELVFAFGFTIGGMILLFRIGRKEIFKGLKDSLGIELLLSVAFVMGFKKVLESTQAIPAVSGALSSVGIPLWLIGVSVPMLVGLMTGVTIAPIGIGFPILIPLLQTHPDFYYYMMLAFAGGIAGVLLSPLHLCLVLTKEYFQADWRGVYRLVWFPVVSILMVGLVWAAIFSASSP